jgi:hypothetical protein
MQKDLKSKEEIITQHYLEHKKSVSSGMEEDVRSGLERLIQNKVIKAEDYSREPLRVFPLQ